MRRLLCLFGFHGWLIYKHIIVKQFNNTFWRTTTYKCDFCGKKKDEIEEISEAELKAAKGAK